MPALADRVKVTTATTGTSTAVFLGPPVQGFVGLISSSIPAGAQVRYVIEDGENWEIGIGVFTNGGEFGRIDRYPEKSSNGNDKISLSGTATLFLTASAADVQPTYSFRVVQNQSLINTSSTQALFFHSSSVTNGRLTLIHRGTYSFKCSFWISGLSSGSNATFSLRGAGNAAGSFRATSVSLSSNSVPSSSSAPLYNQQSSDSSLTTTISLVGSSGSGSNLTAFISGVFVVSNNPPITLIPSIQTTGTASLLVASQSYFNAKLLTQSTGVNTDGWS